MARAGILIHPQELDKFWIDRAKELGITTIGLHPEGGGGAAVSFADTLRLCEDKNFRNLVDYANDCGITIEYEAHALGWLLPREKLEEHPAWSRMNAAGERDFRNCCPSAPEVLDFIADRALEASHRLYRGKKPSHRWFFWTEDITDGYCSCPQCTSRGYTPADQEMLIMNAILRRLRREDPEATLAFLAYDVVTAPSERVPPEKGIFLEIAPMQRDFFTPLTASDDPRNRERVEDITAFVKRFGAENTKILEYWLDNSLYSGWKRPPKAFRPRKEVIEADVAFYRSLGITEISTFACFLGEDYRALYGEPDIAPFTQAVNREEMGQ